MAVPSRVQWKALKKKHDIPDGAVKGVNLGDLIDKVDKARSREDVLATHSAFEKAADTYLKKLDKKKIKDAAGFQKTFLDDYLAEAHNQVKNIKLAADGEALYKAELSKWFTAVQKLDPKKSRTLDLQRFVQLSRGISSVGLRTKGAVDVKQINKIIAKIDELDDNMDYNGATQDDIGIFINVVMKVANAVRVQAKKQGLVK